MSLHNNNIDCVEMFRVALQKGINLFTGAGFSVLPDADGNVLPIASDLCGEICERFSIASKYGHQVFAFLDSCCDDVSVTKLLMQQPNFTVLGLTDDYAFESSKHLLDDVRYHRADITELDREEAQGIYNKIPLSLRKHSKLEYKKTEEEKYSIFEFINSNVKNVLSQHQVRKLLERVKSNSETT